MNGAFHIGGIGLASQQKALDVLKCRRRGHTS